MHRAVRPLAALAFLLCAASPAPAAPATVPYELDASHAYVGFGVQHFGISFVRGRFNAISGEGMVDEQKLQNSTFLITIDAASLDTGFEARDEVLRGEDFLNVEKFPHIVYRVKEVRRTAMGMNLVGELTLHGVTRPVNFIGRTLGPRLDPFGKMRLGFGAVLNLDRSDYGITWNQQMEDGTAYVGDEVRIELEVELVRKQEASAEEKPAPAEEQAAPPEEPAGS